MQIKGREDDKTEEIIQEEIQKEGQRLEQELGPVTFLEGPDFDVQKSFQNLKADMERQEYTGQEQGGSVRKRFTPFMKTLVTCAAALVCIFAFSLRSEATRMWWLKSVERIVGDESGTVVNSDENRVKNTLTEKKATAEIKEKTGLDAPRFGYKPEGMVFDNFECDEAMQFAFMYYVWQEHIIMVYMQGSDTDNSALSIYEGEPVEKEKIETSFGTVKIEERKLESDGAPTLTAEWTYRNVEYCIAGRIDIENLKLIIENMIY